jgi:hypothetical protein
VDGFVAVNFGFARAVLQRGIAALHLVALVSTLNQFRPLLGEGGCSRCRNSSLGTVVLSKWNMYR